MTIDYEGTKNALTERIGATMSTHPTNSVWDQRWVDADRTRLNQVGLLEQAVKSSGWTDAMNKQADTQLAAQNNSLTEGHRQAQSSIATDSAGRGILGSSQEAVQVAHNDAALAVAKTKARQQADELKAAGLRDLGNLEQSLLDSILAETSNETASQNYGLQSQQALISGNELLAQNAETYRNSLSNALGSFVSNAVTPTIDAGFKTADRENDRNYRLAMLTEDANKRAELMANQKTWYGYGRN